MSKGNYGQGAEGRGGGAPAWNRSPVGAHILQTGEGPQSEPTSKSASPPNLQSPCWLYAQGIRGIEKRQENLCLSGGAAQTNLHFPDKDGALVTRWCPQCCA